MTQAIKSIIFVVFVYLGLITPVEVSLEVSPKK